MLARFPRTLVALAFFASVPSLAFAQAPAGTAAAESQPAPVTPLPAGSAAPAPAPAGSAAPASEAPAKPVREATGYAPAPVKRTKRAPGAKSGRTTRVHVDRKAQKGAFVVEPGFELLGDGGSRFFVELGQEVPVEERKAKGAVSFVLKGARNAFRNNYNPLVTEHFNTPVRRAKLSPAGHDLVFTMELRQDVPATHRVVTNKDGHAVFQVDFGAGSFVKEGAQPLPEPADATGGDDTNETIDANEPRATPRTGKGAGPKP